MIVILYLRTKSKLQFSNQIKKNGDEESIMSEWLLFNANSAIFLLYHGENNEMMMMTALYLTDSLSWMFIVLAHWNNSPQIDMKKVYLASMKTIFENKCIHVFPTIQNAPVV